tara:strand:+ start:4663 stop:5421 length:759 start_codon:yes stop_codon:yes gene_type:complete
MTEPTYPDAPRSLIALWEKRRFVLSFAEGEALPPPDCDLAAMAARSCPAAPEAVPGGASGNAQKMTELQRDLAGHSELALLHGLLIAHLRKRDFPAHAPALFHRIWHEQSAPLMATLPSRWLISALITFGDHGETPAQQSLGREMAMLFSLMKLYEFERLHSGLTPDQPFPIRRRAKADLPLDMPQFSLATGGLDINLLAPLWQRAETVPVAGPLACLLLDRLNNDPGTMFRRIASMRETRRTQIARRRQDR